MLHLWLARLCVGVVFFFNVQCALAFLAAPGSYAPAFELEGEVGAAVMCALGVLFLMWNVPYAVALWQPGRNRLSLWEAILMQTIGLVGETGIYFSLAKNHALARAAIERFIAFDGAGLLLLLAAMLLVSVWSPSSERKPQL